MLQQENQFFLLTAQHVARMIEEKREKWSYQNPEQVVKYLNHLHIRTDLGKEGLYSQDLTLLELHAEDAAEMVRLGLSFYDLRTSQYSSDEEYGPDYFIIGAPKSTSTTNRNGPLWRLIPPTPGQWITSCNPKRSLHQSGANC